MNDVQWAVSIFDKYGIKAVVNKENKIIISHYAQPKGITFKELKIDENKLIENVLGCSGTFDMFNSELTTFPLAACHEIKMAKDTKITEMPNLKAVNIFVANEHIKKLPKLKTVGSCVMENSCIKSLPKLQNAGILIIQNSQIKNISLLETAQKLCLIDSPILEIKSLKSVGDLFICSTDENKKLGIKALINLEEVDNMFVANTELKALPKLKKAKKLAFYNCNIKSVKSSIKANVEIQNRISDDELAEKFDSFTNWYNSDFFQKSIDLLSEVINSNKK